MPTKFELKWQPGDLVWIFPFGNLKLERSIGMITKADWEAGSLWIPEYHALVDGKVIKLSFQEIVSIDDMQNI